MAANTGIQDIYDHVKQKIISREFFPGNRIVEEDLASEMGTSRTTVRSAITRLAFDGLVDVVPKKGTYVAKPTMEDMEEVYELRRVLETEAVRRAIPRIDSEALARMQGCIDEQIELEKHYSMQEYVRINSAFHGEIARASGNSYLEKFLEELFNKTAIFLTFYDRSTSNQTSIESHTRILEAIREGDTDKAVEAIIEDNRIAVDDIQI
ncbi:MAG: GntR family transcriptional regulator [Eubacteriaceae bacterium]|nr:GntR family transcriptional regulator [Eubacteriaceae bacterium]